MSNELELEYFQEQLKLAKQMVVVLRYSFERAEPIIQLINENAEINAEHAEILEALTARFARLNDTLTQKLFRAIDALELTDEGSLIDRFNRMEKRGIVISANELIEMRKLRNQIAHEYVIEDLMPLYGNVFVQCEILFNVMDSILTYASDNGWD